MKNKVFSIVLILSFYVTTIVGQTKLRNDTVVKNEVRYVKYKLHKGVGGCGCFIGGMTPELNNGLWKESESKTNLLSKTDSLLVFIGGILTSKSKTIEGSTERIPTYCYKLVISLSTHKLLDCVIFDNNDKPEEKKIPLNELEYKTKFYFERITRFTVKQ